MRSPTGTLRRHRRLLSAAAATCVLVLLALLLALIPGLVPALKGSVQAPPVIPMGRMTAVAAEGKPHQKASQDTGSLLVVLDASGSMLRPDARGQTRMVSAKRAIAAVLAKVPAQTPLGIRVFGTGAAPTRSRAACTDSRLLVPIRRDSAERAITQVAGVRASGWTPIGFALERAAGDLRATKDPFGTVVLVSDGVDECYPGFGPEPCAVARSVSSPAVRLRVHTIGFTVDDEAREQLRCIARVTGGRYSDAADADSLADALRRGLLPPATLPEGPAEPARPAILPTAARMLGLLALAAGAVALVRALTRRRQRSYW
ncbi:MAG: VWA domain-containing protein [Nocardioides sp.]